MKIKICIIIVNMNGKKLLKDCLDSIKKNTFYKNYKIIVVDNNSKDGSQNMIESKFKGIDLIKNKINRGFSGGNNDGINYARRKYNPNYFYLLNNDTLVEKNWLSEVIKTTKKFNEIGIVGSKQFTFKIKQSISAGWIKMFGVKYYFGDKEKEVNWVSGVGFLIKREVINKIGLLDEVYNPAYYEETDFEKRTINAGFKIFHSPKSIIYHKGSGTTKKLNQDEIFYIFYRNRIRYFLKYFSIGYFLPRLISDFFKAKKLNKLPLLFKAYKEGYKLLK